jgi:hypothetical protein
MAAAGAVVAATSRAASNTRFIGWILLGSIIKGRVGLTGGRGVEFVAAGGALDSGLLRLDGGAGRKCEGQTAKQNQQYSFLHDYLLGGEFAGPGPAERDAMFRGDGFATRPGGSGAAGERRKIIRFTETKQQK